MDNIFKSISGKRYIDSIAIFLREKSHELTSGANAFKLKINVRVNERTFYFRVGCRHNDIAMAATGNAGQAGNNSELSGNDSTVYLGKASLAARSGIIAKLIILL